MSDPYFYYVITILHQLSDCDFLLYKVLIIAFKESASINFHYLLVLNCQHLNIYN